MIKHQKKFAILALITAFAGQSFAIEDHSSHNHSHGMTSTIGKPYDASKATKVVKVDLVDTMKFEFNEQLNLKEGDIVRFVVTNKGQIDHEFSIGSEKEQKKHLEAMKKMPDMVHHDGNTITLKPSETKELTWKFTKKETVMFACNIPSHFEAGMYLKTVIK